MAGPGFAPMLSSSPPPMDSTFEWEEEEENAEGVGCNAGDLPPAPSSSAAAIDDVEPVADKENLAFEPPPIHAQTSFNDDDDFGEFADFSTSTAIPPDPPTTTTTTTTTPLAIPSSASPSVPPLMPPISAAFTAIPDFDGVSARTTTTAASRKNLSLSSRMPTDEVGTAPDCVVGAAFEVASLPDSGLCSDSSPAAKSDEGSPDNAPCVEDCRTDTLCLARRPPSSAVEEEEGAIFHLSHPSEEQVANEEEQGDPTHEAVAQEKEPYEELLDHDDQPLEQNENQDPSEKQEELVHDQLEAEDQEFEVEMKLTEDENEDRSLKLNENGEKIDENALCLIGIDRAEIENDRVAAASAAAAAAAAAAAVDTEPIVADEDAILREIDDALGGEVSATTDARTEDDDDFDDFAAFEDAPASREDNWNCSNAVAVSATSSASNFEALKLKIKSSPLSWDDVDDDVDFKMDDDDDVDDDHDPLPPTRFGKDDDDDDDDDFADFAVVSEPRSPPPEPVSRGAEIDDEDNVFEEPRRSQDQTPLDPDDDWAAFDSSLPGEDSWNVSGNDHVERKKKEGDWQWNDGEGGDDGNWAVFSESRTNVEDGVGPTKSCSQTFSPTVPLAIESAMKDCFRDVGSAHSDVLALSTPFDAADAEIRPASPRGDSGAGDAWDGRDVLTKLIDIDTALALSYHWLKTTMKNHLFWSIGVDSRNVISFHKKQVPIFASSLSSTLLEPSKGSPSPNSGQCSTSDVPSASPLSSSSSSTSTTPPSLPPSMSAAAVTPASTPSPPVAPPPALVDTDVGVPLSEMSKASDSKPLDRPKKDSIPPVEFDWKTSGLLNPLDSLEADILGPASADSLEAETPKLGADSTSTPKPAVGLHPLLANLQKSAATSSGTGSGSNTPSSAPSNLSLEVASLIERLPDLSFMGSQVLMFPVRVEPEVLARRETDSIHEIAEQQQQLQPQQPQTRSTINTIS